MVKFKDFSRPLSVFQVLFKANFHGIFKTVLYIQVLFNPVHVLRVMPSKMSVCNIAGITHISHYHIWDTICCDNPKSAYVISTFPLTGYLPVMMITGSHAY